MRDQLEDAARHRDAGYGQAQHMSQNDLPKRFYQDVGVHPVEGGFTVTLDGRAVKTPGTKIPVIVPVSGIATTMAQEWSAQGTHIDPRGMPMVRLVNSALESGEAAIPAFRQEVIKFAAGDLLLYRAATPPSLVDLHERYWDAALVAVARHFGVVFQPTMGIIHQPQPESTLAKLADALEREGLLVLTALVSVTGLTGSGILSIGLWYKLFSPDQVWTAAHVDEDYQIGQWGEDEEAAERRAVRRRDFDTAVNLLDFMRN